MISVDWLCYKEFEFPTSLIPATTVIPSTAQTPHTPPLYREHLRSMVHSFCGNFKPATTFQVDVVQVMVTMDEASRSDDPPRAFLFYSTDGGRQQTKYDKTVGAVMSLSMLVMQERDRSVLRPRHLASRCQLPSQPSISDGSSP